MNEEQAKLKILQEALNAANQPHFETEKYQEVQVNIRPDNSVASGLFVRDTLIDNSYKAHPTTIRAMKKDIFVAGSELFEDLEMLYNCEKCGIELDLQFWHFCPHCEARFPKDALSKINVNDC